MYCHCDTGNHYFDNNNKYQKKSLEYWFKPPSWTKIEHLLPLEGIVSKIHI